MVEPEFEPRSNRLEVHALFTMSPWLLAWLQESWESLVESEMPFSWIHAQKHDFQPSQFSKLICEFLCIPRVLRRTLETQLLPGKYCFLEWRLLLFIVFPHLILVAGINVQENVLHWLDCEITKATVALCTCPNSCFSLGSQYFMPEEYHQFQFHYLLVNHLNVPYRMLSK